MFGIDVYDFELVKWVVEVIYNKGVKNMVIMFGSKGLFVFDGKKFIYLLVFLVVVKNMVGVGDVFNGFLVLGFVKGKLLELVLCYVSVFVFLVVEISNVFDMFEYEFVIYWI